MIVTAWNNSGSGYGLKISIVDRDKYFNRTWQYVVLLLGDNANPLRVNINKKSFWGETCRELISKEIGKWLIEKGYAPWPKGSPPKFIVEPVSDNQFRIIS
jgi:hypothetical protein